MLLSVVIPAYNEEAGIQTAIDTIDSVLSENGIESELIFVDDGSSDKTWEILSKNARERGNVVAVKFSRNFGKEAAVFAVGLVNSPLIPLPVQVDDLRVLHVILLSPAAARWQSGSAPRRAHRRCASRCRR